MRIAALSLLCSVVTTSGIPRPRYFTVRDSIEMTRFDRIGPKASFSPNKRFFAIVTSRGIMRSNSIESTLWLFSTAKVRAFMRGFGSAPAPRAIARIVVVPRVDYGTSYEPIITDIRWGRDSRAVFFLAQDTHGDRRLYTTHISPHSIDMLSSSGYDINNFSIQNGTIAYEATKRFTQSIGERINVDAWDVTGADLAAVLFPHERFLSYSEYGSLYTLHNGIRQKIMGNDRAHPISIPNDNDLLGPFALSHDARTIVILTPFEKARLSWVDYKPENPQWGIKSHDPIAAAASNFRPLLGYTRIDLLSGKAKSLLRAPEASALAMISNDVAAWSPSGTKILLTNTFLPLDGVKGEERFRRRYPCRAAVISIASGAVDCLAFETYENITGEHGTWLDSASFGESDGTIILHLTQLPAHTKIEQFYQYRQGHWQLIATMLDNAQDTQNLNVAVKQNLNTPPALWVTDPTTKKSKKLWDPNPQLAAMDLGEVSIFHWRDTSGHAWTGGMVKPPDYVAGKRYPLVIQTHGFVADEFMTDGMWTTGFAARPLASAGILVLQVEDNREHESQLAEAHDNARGYQAAVKQLDTLGLIDPQRVGIIGFSRTCWYVETALIDYPHLFTAASITDGVDQSYMQYLLFNQREGEQIYGTSPFGHGLEAWAEGAASFHLDQVHTPLLITAISPPSVLGEWEIYSSLRMQKKPVDFMYIPEGLHILQKPLDRLASQQGTVDWFRFWLQEYEDPSLAKAVQYRRWEALRKLQ